MADIGFKVVREGADVSSADKRDLLLSSKYSMLKYHMDTTTSFSLVPGDSDKYSEVSHGLGYVPAFIVYAKYQGNQYFVPSLPRSGGFSEYAYAWASSSVIRCGYAFTTGAYNRYSEEPSASTDYWERKLGVNSFMRIGNSGGACDTALRFQGITIPQGTTISSALIDLLVEDKGAGSGNLLTETYGIDEDNTASFSGDPFGRTPTTAVTNQSNVIPSLGGSIGINVTSIVQEIVDRAGWASGNSMGFLLYDDGSASDVWIGNDVGVGAESVLSINYGSNATVEFRVVVFKDKISP